MYFIGTTNITTEEKKIITLEDVLGFITGATHVPPMGFSSTIEIHFIEGQHPNWNTCYLKRESRQITNKSISLHAHCRHGTIFSLAIR